MRTIPPGQLFPLSSLLAFTAQTTPHVPSLPELCLAYRLYVNRTRLPESDRGTIEVYPLLMDRFSNDLPDVGTDIEVDCVERGVNRDLSVIDSQGSCNIWEHLPQLEITWGTELDVAGGRRCS